MDSRKKAAIVVAALALIGAAVYWFTRPLTPRQLALIGMRACENGDARTLYRFAPEAEKKAYGLTEEKVRGLLGLLALRPAPDKPDKYLITDQPGTGGCSIGKWLTVNNGQPVLFEVQADLRRGHRAELHLPITNLLTLYMVVNGETLGVKDKHMKIVNGLRKIAPPTRAPGLHRHVARRRQPAGLARPRGVPPKARGALRGTTARVGEPAGRSTYACALMLA